MGSTKQDNVSDDDIDTDFEDATDSVDVISTGCGDNFACENSSSERNSVKNKFSIDSILGLSDKRHKNIDEHDETSVRNTVKCVKPTPISAVPKYAGLSVVRY